MSLRLQGQQALSFSSRPCFCYTQIPASHWLRPTHMYKRICLCSHGCSRSNGWCIAACKAGLSVGFNSLSQRSNRTTAMHAGPDHWPAQQHSIKAALSPGTLTQPSTGKQQRKKIALICTDRYWKAHTLFHTQLQPYPALPTPMIVFLKLYLYPCVFLFPPTNS